MSKAWKLPLVAFLAVSWSTAVQAGEAEFRTALRDFLLMEEGGSLQELRQLSDRHGVSTERLVAILGRFFDEGVAAPAGTAERLLAHNSITTLGQLGHQAAVPVLTRASRLTVRDEATENTRRSAISAYVHVRREDSIEFAESILARREFYRDLDRFILYQALGQYAEPSSDESLEKKRAAVRRFLIEAVPKEGTPYCVEKLDEILKKLPQVATGQRTDLREPETSSPNTPTDTPEGPAARPLEKKDLARKSAPTHKERRSLPTGTQTQPEPSGETTLTYVVVAGISLVTACAIGAWLILRRTRRTNVGP